MIRTYDLTKTYDRKNVIDAITLSIPKNKVTSIIGPNGAGKSTLLGMMSRTLEKNFGTVTLDDLPLEKYKSIVLAQRLAIMKQSEQAALRITVEDFVAFGRYPYTQGRLTREDREIIDESIAYMDLELFRTRFIDQLSGGQKQRAYIAAILAQGTEYILLDEPLNNLDMKYASEMLKILRRLVEDKGKTIIIVIHDINFAACYSDHLILLKAGKLAFEGTVSEVMQSDVLEAIYDMPFKVFDLDGKKICAYY